MPALAAFAKAPLPGYAKTRLARAIGPARAAETYAELLSGFLRSVPAGLPNWSFYLYVSRPQDRDWFEGRWPEVQVRVQKGSDLGRRIAGAFGEMFSVGYERAVVAGTDIPDLSAGIVQRAGVALRSRPAVIGPTEDGGYYLIGQRAPGRDLFSGIEWNTDRVYRQTLERAIARGLPMARLPLLYDVDDHKDWLRYVRSGLQTGPGASSPRRQRRR